MTKPTIPTAAAKATPPAADTLPRVDPIPGPRYNFRDPNRERVTQPVGAEPSLTRQEFADDCDINRILAKFQITGALNHFAKYSAEYGDFSACDLQEAQNLIIRARNMFDELPSKIRQEVATPEGFLSFVQDPKNLPRMRELGLALTPPPPAVPPAVNPPASPAATSASGGA